MFCIDKTGIQSTYFKFLLLYILVATNFYKFTYFPGAFSKSILLFFFVVSLYLGIFKVCKKTPEDLYFKRDIYCFILLAILSSIPCFVLYDQSFLDSIRVVASTYAFPLYFLLHKKKVSEKTILYTLLIAALILVFIQIYQQLLPNHVMFGLQKDRSGLEKDFVVRNGLLRFRIGFGGCITFCVLFYAWEKILAKARQMDFVLLMLMVVSIYLLLTRQVLASVALAMFCSIIFMRMEKNKTKIFFILLAGAIFVFFNFENLFGSLLEQSSSEIGNEDYIRFRSGQYFFENIFENNMTVFFGHGLNVGGSHYDAFISRLADRHFFVSDVGFVGAAFMHGIPYVLVYLLVLKKVFWMRKRLPPYIKMYFIATFSTSIMIWPLTQPIQTIIFVLVLYICDLRINQSALALK